LTEFAEPAADELAVRCGSLKTVCLQSKPHKILAQSAVFVYIIVMRIIAGSKRGMKLFSPEDDASRPVLDRVKESVFNVLYKYNMPEGKVVADLFCGVGSFGLEALSRGAEFVTFVEKDHKIAAVLKQNITKADFASRSKVVIADAFKAGAPLAGQEDKYDLVFVDPPYKLTEDVGEKSQLAQLMIALSGQTKAQSLILVRTHFKTELMEEYGIFKMIERRRWGTMAVAFFIRLPCGGLGRS